MSEYHIVNDPEYGFLRVDPVPTQEEVERYYEREFYSSEYPRFNDSSLEVQQEDREFFDSRWAAVCEQVRAHFGRIEGLSVFDVGFGFAQALLYFRDQGMVASGLEPSPEGVEYASAQGLEVYRAGIEEFEVVGERRFDVVTIINVLEHLRRPAETLAKVRELLLAPGGLLVIDVPNDFNDFQIAADARHGLGEWWVCPPNHINYFSVSSLTSLLQRCGYRVVHAEATFPLEMFLLMGDVYVGDEAKGKECHTKRVRFENTLRSQGGAGKLAAFYEALARLDLGRQAVVYATPLEREE